MNIEQFEKAKFLQVKIEGCKEKIKKLEKQKVSVGLFKDHNEINYDLTIHCESPSPTFIIDRLKLNYNELEDVIDFLLQKAYKELEYYANEFEKL